MSNKLHIQLYSKIIKFISHEICLTIHKEIILMNTRSFILQGHILNE